MNNEKIDNCKRKLIKLKEKVKELEKHKLILINIHDELNKGKNIRLNELLYGIELHEEISYLDDWIEFYSKDTEKCKSKLITLEQATKEKISSVIKKAAEPETKKSIENAFKFIFRSQEELHKLTIKEKIFNKFKEQELAKYAIPFIVLLLIITSIFLLKPAITGYVIFGEENIYSENFKLKINESGTYNWTLKNPNSIKSLKASGSVIGNGTVKIYIEKDGKKYLIYKNK